MRVTDEQRNHLHERATETLGADAADTLMELLPRMAWADTALGRQPSDAAVLRRRHHLYERVSETMGSEAAGTLLELLPPVPWIDIAPDIRHALMVGSSAHV